MAATLLSRSGLDALIRLLADDRRVLGPTVRDGAVVIGELHGVGDLPAGVTVETGPGSYRLRQGDGALFAHAVGPDSWKRALLSSRARAPA